MKKPLILAGVALGVFATTAMKAQPVSDHAVIPIGVTLVEIARLHVEEGGNIEFVFNDINDYKNGIANADFYDSYVYLAASSSWLLFMGAEDGTMIGTEDPANTMDLNEVGFTFTWSGAWTCCAAGNEVIATNHNADGAPGTANGLDDLATLVAATSFIFRSGSQNGGDIQDQSFTINWECGTQVAGGTTAMNTSSMLEQDYNPDRYVTNVLLELNTDYAP
ncbi:MAG: hypothetical protein HYY40_13675 [Bacteroidetes bacterium]|nr:hypothetical protein [Bacteroidota bacterium]